MKRVLLGLGSNRAFDEMSSLEILQKTCCELAIFLKNMLYSSVYVTKAMYVNNQNDFYNMVLSGEIADEMTAEALLEELHKIEAKYGRNRSKEIRFGPRSLDIDIELFGEEKINNSLLQIPHPRLAERAFVLIPALEILSDSADKKIRNEFEKYLSKIDLTNEANRVEKFISAKDFFTGGK